MKPDKGKSITQGLSITDLFNSNKNINQQQPQNTPEPQSQPSDVDPNFDTNVTSPNTIPTQNPFLTNQIQNNEVTEGYQNPTTPVTTEAISNSSTNPPMPLPTIQPPQFNGSSETQNIQAPSAPVNEVVTKPSGKRNLFKIFVLFAVVAIILIWGFVIFMYLKNNNFKIPYLSKKVKQTSSQGNTVNNATPTPSNEIKIINGNVMSLRSTGERTLLVNKELFEETGVAGFSSVAISPNNQKICLESSEPSPEPSLYMSDISGSNVSKISSLKKNCEWTPDSRKIVYLNIKSDNEPNIDIYSYDLSSGLETNYTKPSRSQFPERNYSIVDIIADTINCTFEDIGSDGIISNSGTCTINLNSGDLTTS